MKKEINLSVVIPAYNEEKIIGSVIKDIKEVLDSIGINYEIIAINDGSTDNTANILKEMNIRVINHPINKGYGRSLLSGIENARYEWVMIIDSDGSYPPKEITKLLEYIPQFDLVIGARKGSLFWGDYRKAILRYIYLRIAQFVAGEKVEDPNSGLRIFRKSDIKKYMPIMCYGYSFTTTMTLSYTQSARFIKFIPIEFTERTGKSKVKLFRDILRTLQLMTQIILYYNPLKFFVVLFILTIPLWFLHYQFVIVSILILISGFIIETIRLSRLK
jgi:glycosyltransferase involved in cell wall biosynthesis